MTDTPPSSIEMTEIKDEPNFDPILHTTFQIKEEESDTVEAQLQPLEYIIKCEELEVDSLQDVPPIINCQESTEILLQKNEPQFLLSEDHCIQKEFSKKQLKLLENKNSEKKFSKVSKKRKVKRKKQNVKDNKRKKKLRGTYGKFLCDLCGMRLSRRHCLINHMLCKHIDNKGFICKICNKKFIFNARLQRHIKQVHSSLHYNCAHCEKSFKLKDYLQRHLLKWHIAKKKKIMVKKRVYNQEVICCKVCNEKFKNKQLFINHSKIIHNIKLKIYKCEFCNKKYVCNEGKKRHELAKHVYTNNNFKCKYCDKCYKLPAYLSSHIKKAHEGKLMYCCHCSYNTRNRTLINDHMLRKHFPPYECKICLIEFKNLVSMQRHDMDVHNKFVTMYSCDLCNYRSLSKSNATRHKKSHLKTKNISNKKFESRKDHQSNIQIMSNSDNVQQKISSKKYKNTPSKSVRNKNTMLNKNKLTTHKKLKHSTCNQDKDFLCTFCDEKFQSRYVWQKHIKNMHKSDVHKKVNNTNYNCTICLSIFESEEALQIHLEEHDEVILGI